MSSIESIRRDLTQRLEAIQKRQGKVDRDLRRGRNPDSEERAQEAENDEVLSDLSDRGREEIEQIQRALMDIEAGTYGRCDGCGGEISEDRLTALPFARTCISCAS